LIKKADAIEPQKQVQYRASAVDKMEIESVMISFMENTTSSQMRTQMGDQNYDFIAKESCKSLSVFLKLQLDDKWSECRKLKRQQRTSFRIDFKSIGKLNDLVVPMIF